MGTRTKSRYQHHQRSNRGHRQTFKVGATLVYRERRYACLEVAGKGEERVVTWETDCKDCGVFFTFMTGAHYAFAMRHYCDEHRPEPKQPRQSHWEET